MMGKKKTRKHQKERDESSASTDIDDIGDGIRNNDNNISAKNCLHVVKSVSLSGVKKALRKSGFSLGRCESCQPINDDGSTESDVWICLQCGHQGCGRYTNAQHALFHFKTPRSSAHSLVANVTSWNVWCYECDDDISLDSNKRLLECVKFVQRRGAVIKTSLCNGKKFVEVDNKLMNDDSCPKYVEVGEVNGVCGGAKGNFRDIRFSQVKGLRNLGNTCFFNAIMQNLTRSHWLTQILEKFCSIGVQITLTASNVNDIESEGKDDSSSLQLDPLQLNLKESGPLTLSLLNFFREMQAATKINKVEVINPSQVLNQICKKAPQFRGFKQQDSHELLRHLIDGVRTEEIRRQKTAVLNSFSLTEKVDPKRVDNKIKKKIKAYGFAANHTIIDWLFSGQLLSTVMCQECQKSSQVFEQFLDLSLPVTEEKAIRPSIIKRFSNESKSAELGTTRSKYQEKKLKHLAKKEAKSKHRNNKAKALNGKESSDKTAETIQMDDKESENESDSDADEEDNAEGETKTEVEPFFDGTEKKLVSCMDNMNLENNPQENGRTADENARLRENWIARSMTTLGPRYQASSHECSILSCLNQFTAPELLTGNNKFGCENCTKMKEVKSSKKSGNKKEMVYSNASKQLLIFSPPAMLTLHLKRFQQVGHSLRKVNRHVDFPLFLDIASFCSSVCVDLSNMSPSQSKVLYSLYGVVEHSGRLASGHYVAYVKVRPNDDIPDRFINRKSSVFFEVDNLIEEMTKNVEEGRKEKHDKLDGTSEDVNPSVGKWFYISDSSVSEISEENVLRSQAYILFYERIV